MYRSQERVVTAEPLVHDIDGLLKNPAYNATHTAAVLGQAAQDAVSEAFIFAETADLDLSLGPHVMTTSLDEEAQNTGFADGEADVDEGRRNVLNASLRPPGAFTADSPTVLKLQDELTDLKDLVKFRDSEIATEEARLAAKGQPVSVPSTRLRNLREQKGAATTRLQRTQARIAEEREKISPLEDDFSRLKAEQELARLDPSKRTTALEALTHGLGSRGQRGPKGVADTLRAVQDARHGRGLTPKQQRQADEAARRSGETEVHKNTRGLRPLERVGSWVGKATDAEKNNAVSQETSHNRYARVGNVLQIGDRSYFVQGVVPEVGLYTQPDGSKVPLYYVDEKGERGAPVVADNKPDILLDSANSKPEMGIAIIDPATGMPIIDPATGMPSRKIQKVDPGSKSVTENIGTGEEFVILGRLFTREESEDILKNGATAEELAPQAYRLGDLVARQDVSREANNAQRLARLEESLTWQYEDPNGHSETPAIPKHFGNDGKFIPPFSHTSHRREYYSAIRQDSAEAAARSARRSSSTPKVQDDPRRPTDTQTRRVSGRTPRRPRRRTIT